MDPCSLSGFHIFGKWSEEITRGDNKVYQYHKCTMCNLIEYRKVKVLVNEVVESK